MPKSSQAAFHVITPQPQISFAKISLGTSFLRRPPNRNRLYNAAYSLAGGDAMAEPSYEELKAKIAELEKQGGGRRTGALEFLEENKASGKLKLKEK
jgi:hypothetical protein